ncbi:MucBP domain-containing protein [Ligilactobacillus saerimneri]
MKETTQKQPKYTLRKKRTGGGAASVLVGTMILSGMVIAGKSEKVVHADTLEPTTNQENTGENLANVSEYTLRSTPTVTKKDELAETADQPASISEATTNVADAATSTSNSGSPETTTIDEATTSAPVPTTSTAPVVSRANAETPPVWAAEPQVTITNIHMNKDKVIESQGTDIQVTFDWEATGIYKGYKIETPLPEAFDSITKQVKYTFGTTEIPNMGTMTLDYDNHKLITEFTYDMNPLKIYRGKTTVGTFINRNYFTELDTKRNVYFQTADGKTVSIPLEVVYDEVQRYSTSGQDYNYNVVYVTATHQKLTEDGSQSNVTWHGIVNAGNIQMKDLALYASPQLINKVYRTTGTDPRNRVVIDFATAQSHTFTMLPDSFAIYEVEVYPSMGFDRNTMKKLVLGKDYEIIPGIPGDPNGFIFHMIGDYADTTKSLIMEGTAHYENLTPDEGEVSEGSTKTEVQGSAALSYLDPSNKVVPGDFSAVVTLMNSEMTSISSEEDTDAKGSVIVVHIAGDTGELLSAEEYVAHDVEVGTHYTTEAGNFTNIGYEFNRMGYLSAPATGSVQDGVLRVTYVYMPIAKTGSVDVKYVDTEGNILPGGEVQAVKTDVPAGTNYETDPKTFAGYEFVGMAETSAKADGTIIADQTLHVIYVYRKLAEPVVKKGSVDVKYIDRATGKEIPGGELAAVVTDAEAGTSYGTSKKDFDGYTFAGLDEKSAAASGKVEADTTLHVIYTYDKLPDPVVEKGSVDVIYVDEHGNVLPGGDLKVVKDNVPVGESYSTTQKDFAGYTFVRMGTGSADVSGKVTPGTQHVIYVYSKNVIPEIKKGSVDLTSNTLTGLLVRKFLVGNWQRW